MIHWWETGKRLRLEWEAHLLGIVQKHHGGNAVPGIVTAFGYTPVTTHPKLKRPKPYPEEPSPARTLREQKAFNEFLDKIHPIDKELPF